MTHTKSRRTLKLKHEVETIKQQINKNQTVHDSDRGAIAARGGTPKREMRQTNFNTDFLSSECHRACTFGRSGIPAELHCSAGMLPQEHIYISKDETTYYKVPKSLNDLLEKVGFNKQYWRVHTGSSPCVFFFWPREFGACNLH